MANEIGIFVTNERNMHHILGISRAATTRGANVRIFLTWTGTKLARDPQFPELCKVATVAVCADSYKNMGYDPEKDLPAGLVEKQMSTQSKHVDIVNQCDIYLTL